MARGGKRSGAGRKRLWRSGPADKAIKLPGKLVERVLAYARELDAESPIPFQLLDQHQGAQLPHDVVVEEKYRMRVGQD